MKVLVLGGTKYFGKRLVELLIKEGHDITVATRGQAEDSFGNAVRKAKVDREDRSSVRALAESGNWDVVYDQICYGPDEALASCEAFAGRAGRYVHTSTGSVYTTYDLRVEKDFDPYAYPIRYGHRSAFEYGEGKRQAEAVFFQKAQFPVVAMRIPVVLGPDDYTERLEFHIDRVRADKTIVVPRLAAETSFISSAETAAFLAWLGKNDVTGPINGCSNGRISMAEILDVIERRVGKKALVASSGPDEDATPFLDANSRYNDNGLARGLGFEFAAIRDWFAPLVDELASRSGA
jgi:nucleoside-diphosphate-sugar epimerase